jgi:hypothetical protein
VESKTQFDDRRMLAFFMPNRQLRKILTHACFGRRPGLATCADAKMATRRASIGHSFQPAFRIPSTRGERIILAFLPRNAGAAMHGRTSPLGPRF